MKRLAHDFFTVRSPFKHPHDKVKVVTALLGTGTCLRNYYSVCKSSPFLPFLFLYICKLQCLIQSPHQLQQPNYPQGTSMGLLFLFQPLSKKGMRGKGVNIFTNQNAPWLDIYLFSKMGFLLHEIHNEYLVKWNVWHFITKIWHTVSNIICFK